MEIHFHADLLHTKTVDSLLLLIITFTFFLFICSADPRSFDNTTFKFTSFDPNMSDIVYERDAYAANKTIQLNTNKGDKFKDYLGGRATYKKPMHLWDESTGNLADFATKFSFFIYSQGNHSYGDGFAFFLTSNGSKLPPLSQGGNLCLNTYNSTISPNKTSAFVAVEFDTYVNTWDPQDGEHVGIDINSITSTTTNRWGWTDIVNGFKAYAWIKYDSKSKNLSVAVTNGEFIETSQNITTLNSVIDLKEYLPPWVTFGFSGATGTVYEVHNIGSWEFNSSLQISTAFTSDGDKNCSAPAPAVPIVPAVPTASATTLPRRKRKTGSLWVVIGVITDAIVLGLL